MKGRLLIVSNRLPVTVSIEDGRPTVRRSVGGLATGLRGPHEQSNGLWIGWPGILHMPDRSQYAEVDRQLAEFRAVPLSLNAREIALFYDHISNGVLWPLCHDRIDRLPLRVIGWDVFESVNSRYADVVAEHYRPGDTVWVHDYQLMRVPALLRQRIPKARIGFFLHVPFPSPDIFSTLPQRRQLVAGILGADLVGFHTARYLAHFQAVVRRLFGIEADDDGVLTWDARQVRLGAFPMSIDAADFGRRAGSREVSAKVIEYRDPRQRLLVGIDRLDYSKGIPRRLLAFEQLLTAHPEWRERVRLIQVAVPSRDRLASYRRIRREVNALVGRINGKFATPTWTPVHYLHHTIGDDVLLALYRAADVMLVTPVRDGMNLVAKEFPAARIDEEGVLVLSEFAGAADELTDALLVNPYDVDGTAETIHQALIMDGPERRRRMRAMRSVVFEYDVHRWSTTFLAALEGEP